MSLENVQYRSVIRFLFMRGKTLQEIVAELNAGYGLESPSLSTVKRWFNEFKRGRTSVFDEEKSGRPSEINENVTEKLQEIVKQERRITTRELTSRLNVSKGTVNTLLSSFGIRKLCSRFIPRFLTAEMQSCRLDCCQKNLELFEQFGDLFLVNIITMDETTLSLYVPESKRESLEWKFPGEASTKKMRSSAFHRKAMMLTLFWDANGVILADFLNSGTNINSEYYSNLVLEARKKRRKSRLCDLYYLADNAPVHTSQHSKAVFDTIGMRMLQHPPYSPDLAPSDFYLFRHLKKHLRGERFNNKDDLKAAVTNFLNEKPTDFFQKAFSELVVRWRKCVNAEGNYIEK